MFEKEAKIGIIQMDNTKTTMILMEEMIPNSANFSELVKVQKPTAVVRFVKKVTAPILRIIVYKALILLPCLTTS